MEEQTLDLADYIDAVKRRRTSILVIFTTIFLLGATAAMLWPPTYKSSATILIKEQDIPPDLVRSTVTSYAAQRIQAISQKVMARPKLQEIIDKYDLFVDKRERLTSEEIFAEMRKNIDLEMINAQVIDPRTGRPASAMIAFQLSFSGEHPLQVQKVANELMSLFLQENLKERSEKASETYAFMNQETERLSRIIKEQEAKIATFKEEHANSLPELNQLNLQMMNRVDNELSDIDSKIRSQEESKIFLTSQLAQVKPYGANASLDPATRLQVLRTEYLGLVARYSSDHPDVKRMQREIQGLELETGQIDSSAAQAQQLDALRGELAAMRKKYSDSHPDVVKLQRQIRTLENTPPTRSSGSAAHSAAMVNPDNPTYLQLQSQLAAADREIYALKTKKQEWEAKLSDYENRLTETPQVEREYREMNRELQNSVSRYQDLLAKKMSAQISQTLEKDSKGERFEIVEPPILPQEPISPNRPAILFLSFVLALGCGIGYAAVAESLDDAVHGSKSLVRNTGAIPLAVIPYLVSDKDTGKRKHYRTAGIAAAVAAIILAIAMTHYFWTPLDVLWYKALRKADVAVNT